MNPKYKDATPIDTFNRVESILQKLGIRNQERWFEIPELGLYSMSLSAEGTNFSVNGKGTTKDYCKASAYGEYMERLQSCITVKISRNERKWLVKTMHVIDKNSSSLKNSFNDLLFSNDYSVLDSLAGNDGKIITVPVRNMLTKEILEVPYHAIESSFASNGMAGGNSEDEATVQGLSEICERYALREIIMKRYTPPMIPDECIQIYSNVFDAVEKLRKQRLIVDFYDCSLGIGLPVAAVAIRDPEKQSLNIHFGSHPKFSIAIERCMTEAFQGRVMNNIFMDGINMTYNQDEDYLEMCYRGMCANSSGFFPIDFFQSKPSWGFRFWDSSLTDNSSMKDYLIKILSTVSPNLYVRDMSFLGFHSYQFMIPGVSNLLSNKHLVEALNIKKTVDDLFENRDMFTEDILKYFIEADIKDNLALTQALFQSQWMNTSKSNLIILYMNYAIGNMDNIRRMAYSLKPFLPHEMALIECMRYYIVTGKENFDVPMAMFDPMVQHYIRDIINPKDKIGTLIKLMDTVYRKPIKVRTDDWLYRKLCIYNE